MWREVQCVFPDGRYGLSEKQRLYCARGYNPAWFKNSYTGKGTMEWCGSPGSESLSQVEVQALEFSVGVELHFRLNDYCRVITGDFRNLEGY